MPLSVRPGVPNQKEQMGHVDCSFLIKVLTVNTVVTKLCCGIFCGIHELSSSLQNLVSGIVKKNSVDIICHYFEISSL